MWRFDLVCKKKFLSLRWWWGDFFSDFQIYSKWIVGSCLSSVYYYSTVARTPPTSAVQVEKGPESMEIMSPEKSCGKDEVIYIFYIIFFYNYGSKLKK